MVVVVGGCSAVVCASSGEGRASAVQATGSVQGAEREEGTEGTKGTPEGQGRGRGEEAA